MIYFILDTGTRNIKIGYSREEPKKRLQSCQTGNPNKLYLIGYIDGDTKKETLLHNKFNNFKTNSGGTEWFSLSVKEIINLIQEEDGHYDAEWLCYINENWFLADKNSIISKNSKLNSKCINLETQITHLNDMINMYKKLMEQKDIKIYNTEKLCEELKNKMEILNIFGEGRTGIGELFRVDHKNGVQLSLAFVCFLQLMSLKKPDEEFVSIGHRQLAKLIKCSKNTVFKLLDILVNSNLIKIHNQEKRVRHKYEILI